MTGDMSAKAIASATLRPVIVRACTECGGPRQIGSPCAKCGNPEPPLVQDLGVQSAYYRNPFKQAAWLLIGQHLAARRARKASKEACG